MQINHFCLFGLFYIFDMLFRVGIWESVPTNKVSVAIFSRSNHRLTGLLCYVHIIKKPSERIPSTDLHYRLVQFYGLSTINSFLNTENGIVFFNTLINNFHVYTLTIYYP